MDGDEALCPPQKKKEKEEEIRKILTLILTLFDSGAKSQEIVPSAILICK